MSAYSPLNQLSFPTKLSHAPVQRLATGPTLRLLQSGLRTPPRIRYPLFATLGAAYATGLVLVAVADVMKDKQLRQPSNFDRDVLLFVDEGESFIFTSL
ncbi:hypothetical protein FRC03_009594 [Tulasnella sp. 419]|nr:hypothetical protein FRC02_010716 [Tulasnella sp. 418]KAG8970321.1 hypothetical protein FRC03_009594 [Tulasnella sp. 419]